MGDTKAAYHEGVKAGEEWAQAYFYSGPSIPPCPYSSDEEKAQWNKGFKQGVKDAQKPNHNEE